MKRFSVLYQLNERYHHIASDTLADARTILEKLSADKRRKPVGIYDDKTELIEWDPVKQQVYDNAAISEQAQYNQKVVTIAQALRRRDASWQSRSELKRPTFFA